MYWMAVRVKLAAWTVQRLRRQKYVTSLNFFLDFFYWGERGFSMLELPFFSFFFKCSSCCRGKPWLVCFLGPFAHLIVCPLAHFAAFCRLFARAVYCVSACAQSCMQLGPFSSVRSPFFLCDRSRTVSCVSLRTFSWVRSRTVSSAGIALIFFGVPSAR